MLLTVEGSGCIGRPGKWKLACASWGQFTECAVCPSYRIAFGVSGHITSHASTVDRVHVEALVVVVSRSGDCRSRGYSDKMYG